MPIRTGRWWLPLKEAEKAFIPAGDDVILKGDSVVIISDHEGVQNFRRYTGRERVTIIFFYSGMGL
jgi:hypothetical protein